MNNVFIHGAGGTGKTWAFQKRIFPGHYLELHAEGGEETIAGYAEYVKAHVDKNHIDHVALIGHSMGGATALTYALKYDVERLILVGTGSRLKVAPQILETLAEDYPSACRLILDYAFARGMGDSLYEASLEDMLIVPQSITLADFKACDAYDVSDRLHEIRVPSCIICGTLDRLTPPKYSRFLADRIKDSRLRLIEGGGHMVMLEKPDEFNSILKGFLEMV